MIDRWIRELIDMIDRKRQRLRNIPHTLIRTNNSVVSSSS
jgi:hypothetical protein